MRVHHQPGDNAVKRHGFADVSLRLEKLDRITIFDIDLKPLRGKCIVRRSGCIEYITASVDQGILSLLMLSP